MMNTCISPRSLNTLEPLYICLPQPWNALSFVFRFCKHHSFFMIHVKHHLLWNFQSKVISSSSLNPLTIYWLLLSLNLFPLCFSVGCDNTRLRGPKWQKLSCSLISPLPSPGPKIYNQCILTEWICWAELEFFQTRPAHKAKETHLY